MVACLLIASCFIGLLDSYGSPPQLLIVVRFAPHRSAQETMSTQTNISTGPLVGGGLLPPMLRTTGVYKKPGAWFKSNC